MNGHSGLQNKRSKTKLFGFNIFLTWLRIFLLTNWRMIGLFLLLITSMTLSRAWIVGKADFVLMIMRVANKDFIDVHDEHESKHCNNHGEWEIAIAMQITRRSNMLIFLIEIQIKVKNSLGDDVQ